MEKESSNVSGVQATPVLKKFKSSRRNTLILVATSLVIIVAGVGTGYLLSRRTAAKGEVGTKGTEVTTNAKGDVTEAGVEDTSAFPDEAEGVLKEGGIGGEGTHYLDRALGPEKNVYLFSTTLNLQSFVDKKVKVWGQTVSGKKAGWLMDVGRIKII